MADKSRTKLKQKNITKARLRKLAIKLSKEEKHQVKNIEDIMLDASESFR
tara:strand:- start:9510 stop:9659 length:150 start_codon:yes stop_codon:yes gene_type:complete